MFFFEKKGGARPAGKKLLFRCRGLVTSVCQDLKVFCFFFSKKKAFLPIKGRA
jgi:hypothetical protein